MADDDMQSGVSFGPGVIDPPVDLEPHPEQRDPSHDEVMAQAAQQAHEQEQNSPFQKFLEDWMNLYHGSEEQVNIDDLRDQVRNGKITPSQYYIQTGRVWAGANPTKEDQGRTKELSGPGIHVDAPGLDQWHNMNPKATQAPSNDITQGLHPWEKPGGGVRPVPGSVDLSLKNPSVPSPIPRSITTGITSPITSTFRSGQFSGFKTPYGTVASRSKRDAQ